MKRTFVEKLNFLNIFLSEVSVFYSITFTTNNPTYMTKKLLFLVSAMTVFACLAQANQQVAAYSNMGTYAQKDSVPASPIPAYEVSVDDFDQYPVGCIKS